MGLTNVLMCRPAWGGEDPLDGAILGLGAWLYVVDAGNVFSTFQEGLPGSSLHRRLAGFSPSALVMEWSMWESS